MPMPDCFKLTCRCLALPLAVLAVAGQLACKREGVVHCRVAPAPVVENSELSTSASAIRHEVVLGSRCRIRQVQPCAFRHMRHRTCRSVFIRHEQLAGGRLLFTFPEGVRFRPLCGQHEDTVWTGGPALKEPQWIVGEDQLSYVQRWRPTGSGQQGLTLKARWRLFCAGPDSVGVELVVANLGSRETRFVEPMVCLAADKNSCSGLSTFSHSRGAARQFHTLAGWTRFNNTAQVSVEGISYRGARGCYLGKIQANTGLVISESPHKDWRMGLGWDRTLTLSVGAQDCIHSHPQLQRLRPGETATRRGRIYLSGESKEDLLRRFRSAMGQ